MRSRPDGTPRRLRICSSAALTSIIAGATRASSNSPASVSPTLRVVRFIRRRPSRSSRLRRRWLRLDTETRCSIAARRKFRVRATATKASRSRRSMSLIVRYNEQAILDCLSYRDNKEGACPLQQRAVSPAAKQGESHETAPTRFKRPQRLDDRPRLHGYVGLLRARRPRREHQYHPRRAGGRDYTARHRRFLWHGPQRDADRRGAQGPSPRPCPDLGKVRRAARSRAQLVGL